MARAAVALALVLGAALAIPAAAAAVPDAQGTLPTGPFVARVYYAHISDLDALAGYDMWETNNLVLRYVLVSMDRGIWDDLRMQGWRLEVDPDATAMLHPDVKFGRGDSFSGGYRTVAELQADLASINAANPIITDLVDYGDSWCKTGGGCMTPGGDFSPGWDLQAIRVTNEAIPGPKPVYFLVANVHAREITTPELAMNMLDWLITGYGTNADVTWIVDHQETWIVPSINPDGHWIVELGALPQYGGTPFMQRKTANDSAFCATWPPNSFSHYGVDGNRNHSFNWNTGGSTSAACDQTYRGVSAASEPETSALEALVIAHVPDQRGPLPSNAAPATTQGILITMHSYGGLVLWPWGNTTQAAPNKTGLKAIGDKLATYNGYQSCQPPTCLYAVSGNTDDFSYGVLGIPSFTIEVGTQFMPPFSQIASIQWPGNGPALQYAAKIARTPYKMVNGPDALNVAAAASGTNRIITATLDETKNGGQTVKGAVYFLDTPQWKAGIKKPMQPADGAFNSTVEGATVTISTVGLTPGQHIVWVYGQDSALNIGPPAAVFFTVP